MSISFLNRNNFNKVTKYYNGIIFHDGFRKKEQRHVGAPPGAVNSKKTQTGSRETKQVAVGM